MPSVDSSKSDTLWCAIPLKRTLSRRKYYRNFGCECNVDRLHSGTRILYDVCLCAFSWKDGHALCDLVDSIKPGTLPREIRPSEPLGRIDTAMDKAETELGVPRVMEPEDMLDGADDLSTMTYVSYFQEKVRSKHAKKPNHSRQIVVCRFSLYVPQNVEI